MKTTFFCICFLLAANFLASPQDRTSVSVHYQYALPIGAFKKDFISKGSPRGLDLDIMYGLSMRWRIGGALSYQDFYQKKDRNTYAMEDGSDISAVLSNSLQTTVLQARAYFLPMGADSSRLQPFIMSGGGINMIQYEQLLGEFNNGSDAVLRFAAHAGAGINYTVGTRRRTRLSLGVVYNYMPLNVFDLKNASNLAFNAGVRITLRNGGRSGDVWQQRKPDTYYRNW